MPRQPLAAVKRAIVRLYALSIIVVIVGATYMAVAYLVKSIFRPTPVPREYLDWQAHIEVDALRDPNRFDQAGASGRAPLGHYHALGRWVQASPRDGCTLSGCHGPLPHAKNVATRAFANFHAVFLTCQMCHQAYPGRPARATWISTTSGEPQAAPAILQLVKQLELGVDKIARDPAGIHPTIVDLLRKTLAVSGRDPLLEYLLMQIDTSEPGSPVWRHAVEQLSAELPDHLRGEYGAKLAPRDVGSDYLRIEKQLTAQADRKSVV